MGRYVIRASATELPFLLRQRADALPGEIEKALLDGALATQRVVAKDSPVDLGLYKGSWEVKQRSHGAPVVLHNTAPHAGIIELGARPFRPPFAPIFEWAKRKAGDLALAGLIRIGPQAFRRTKAGFLRYRGQASLEDDDLEAVRSFAWAVVNAIGRRGLRPKRVMGKHLEFAKLAVKRAFDEHHLQRFARDPRPGDGGGR